MNYRKIILWVIILIITTLFDIIWFKLGDSIKFTYLGNNNIRDILELLNGILKIFWHLFPFILLGVGMLSKNNYFKHISINNLIHFLIIIGVVLLLKYTTGKARPSNARNPFDYNFLSIYTIKQKNEEPEWEKDKYKCHTVIDIKFCILKNHDSFPSGETAISAVQALYLYKIIGRIFLISGILVPILRLLLYRHWWTDCVFSILLSILIIDITGKNEKKIRL